MIPRFFCPQPLAANSLADLPPAVAHHALRVLRLGVGDAVVLFNGEGGAYPGRIAVAGRGVRVQLAEWDSGERESPLDLTLAQALPSADKMDFVVQKAVELGVARIQPLLAARSVVRLAGERAERRVAHWQQVAVSSCSSAAATGCRQLHRFLICGNGLAACRRTMKRSGCCSRPRAGAGRANWPARMASCC